MSSEKATEDKRVPYRLEIEPDAFNQNAETKYLTSIEFCKLTSEIFNSAFCNFYGSRFETNTGRPTINLFFTHMDGIPESGVDVNGMPIPQHIATQRFSGNKVGSTVIDKTRGRDNLMNNGDKFVLTEDGKDIIKPLLFSNFYNGGKPNWNQFVTEISENPQTMYGQPLHLTKVSGIDPVRLAGLIWGIKDNEGPVDYGIYVVRNMSINTGFGMPGVQTGGNYVLSITRAHKASLASTYESLGLGSIGSNIIR